MKYVYIFLLYTLSLNAQLLTPTMTPQTLGGLRQFSQSMSGRANYNNRGGFSQTVIPNRMMPYAAGIQNQQRPQQQTLNQNQQQPQVRQPLRAHNNKYPVNKFSTMGFGGYKRINLRDGKAQALAAQRYKTTLATLRISLRGYRMNFGKPTTPPTNNNNNNGGTTPTPPKPGQPPTPPTPQPPTTPGNNDGGQVGIGGGPGPLPPAFPGGPVAIGMPAPQPRPAVQPPIPAVGMPAPQLR